MVNGRLQASREAKEGLPGGVSCGGGADGTDTDSGGPPKEGAVSMAVWLGSVGVTEGILVIT